MVCARRGEFWRWGISVKMQLTHEDYQAFEYEFYIPAIIWQHPAVQAFLHQLRAIQPAATVFEGLLGLWGGEMEATNVFRMIVREGEYDLKTVRMELHREIDELMLELAKDPEAKQEAFMFTERALTITMAKLPSPL